MRLLRRIATIFFALLVIAGGGLVGLIANISPDKIVADGVSQIEQVTGFSVETDPGATLSYWPNPGLRVSGLTVVDASGRQIVEAPAAIIGVSYDGLLKGHIRAGSVHLIDPSIDMAEEDVDRVLQDPRGAATWGGVTRFSTLNAAINFTVGDRQIHLADADISIDHAGPSRPTTAIGQAIWNDRVVRAQIQLEDLTALHGGRYALIELETAIAEATAQFRGRVRLAGEEYPHVRGRGSIKAATPGLVGEVLGIDAPILGRISDATTELEITSQTDRLWIRARTAGTMRGRETSLDTVLSANAGWMQDKDFALDIVNRTGGLYSAHFNGKTDLTDQLSGTLRGSILDLPNSLNWADLTDVEVNWSRANFGGDILVAKTGIAVQSIDLQLDDKTMRGSIAADLRGDQPLISASIQARDISLPITAWGKGSLEEVRNALNAEALALDVVFENTWIAGVWVDRIDATMTQDSVGLIAEAPRLDVFGGTSAMTIGAKVDPAAPVEGTLRAAELDAKELMKALGLPDVTGRVGGELRFQLLGDDYRLTGLAGNIVLTDGAIPVPDLGAVAQGQNPTQKMTVVDALSADVSLNDAAVEFSDLQLTVGSQTLAGRMTLAGNSVVGRLVPREQSSRREIVIDGTLEQIKATAQTQRPPEQVQDVDTSATEQPAEAQTSEEERAETEPRSPTVTNAAPAAPGRSPEEAETPENPLTVQDQIAEAATGEPELEVDAPAAPEVLQSPVPLPAPR